MHNSNSVPVLTSSGSAGQAAKGPTLRILHVIRTLDPAWGGPVEGVRNLTAQAMERGYNAEVVCADDPQAPWLPSWNPKIHAVGAGSVGKYGFTRGLDRWLAGNLGRFDVIVVNGIWMYFGYAVWKATRHANIPYFVFIHGALDPWFRRHYPLKHVKKTIYWKLFEHKVLRDAERTLFTTEEEMSLADRAFEPYECRAEVSGYGIVRPELPENFNKQRYVERLSEAHPTLRNRGFILFLSRVHEKKGVDLLLKAFAASKDSLKGTALVIAGPPGDKNIVERLKRLASSLGVSQDVVWTGPLYGTAKWEALQAADIYALPSHQENFGISVVEALACGLPVLVSDKVNIWREIQATNSGIVAPDDVSGTTRLLKEWGALPDDARAEMRRNARQCFATHFDIAVSCDRFFALLRGDSPARPVLSLSGVHAAAQPQRS
jgi:glycosyltransferase involved in cell wall biosynthesis